MRPRDEKPITGLRLSRTYRAGTSNYFYHGADQMSDQEATSEIAFLTSLIFAVGLVAACLAIVMGWAWL